MIGKDLKIWIDKQISYVNNPDNKYANRFVNKFPELIVAVKELKAYELECQKQQILIGIDHIKKLFNEYIHDVNHLTEKWSREAIIGNDLKIWIGFQISYVNNPDNKYATRFVNQHPQMIDAVKDLESYELNGKKFQELKKNTRKKYQFNNVDLDDNLDDDIEQESVII